jgi:2-keto-4-pentenoate hydratase
MIRHVTLAASIGLLASPLWAECASEAEVAAFVESYLAGTPARALAAGGDMEDALCTQAMLVTALEPHLGAVVGYKVGLTSGPAQERFGVSEPVMGVFYESMMLEDGAEVPVSFGAVPLFEADLVLVVGDAGINAATTPEEAMAHISAVHPFIELPDLALAQGEPMTGVTITAMGVGARSGVVGAAIPVEDAGAMLAALADMQVTVTAADGTVMAEAPGAAVLGNPVNAVLWLVAAGVTLEPGDLVSVGSIGPLLPPAKAMGGATVTYAGLPGDPSVSVVFTE